MSLKPVCIIQWKRKVHFPLKNESIDKSAALDPSLKCVCKEAFEYILQYTWSSTVDIGHCHREDCRSTVHYNIYIYIYIYICMCVCIYACMYWPILIMVRMFANGPGNRDSVPARVMPKTQKRILDASFLSNQYYKVLIKSKCSNPGKAEAHFPPTVVAIEKRTFGSPSNTVDQLSCKLYQYLYIYPSICIYKNE